MNRLYDNGADAAVAGGLLGHAPPTSARYYRQASFARKEKGAEAAGLLGYAEGVIAPTTTTHSPTVEGAASEQPDAGARRERQAG